MKGRRRTNKIEKLRNDRGDWRHKGPELNDLIFSYFQQLFTSSPGDMEDVLSCVTSKISHSQNTILTREVFYDEVKRAVFNMHQDKSSGPDQMVLISDFIKHIRTSWGVNWSISTILLSVQGAYPMALITQTLCLSLRRVN